MYKVYTATDFVYEINKNISKTKYTLQLFLSEYDFLAISDTILNLTNTEIDVTVIISALTEKKSLRIVNLFNRIIQSGVAVHWNTDNDLYENDVHFAIIDKRFAIQKKSDYFKGEGAEAKIIFLSNLFDSFRLDSNEIKLLTGDITIKFETDKTFVQRNTYVNVSWEVKNAHRISINNTYDDLEPKGKKAILINDDTILKMEAENREHKVSKQLIIKILQSSSIEFTVEAFDSIINEYVVLKSNNKRNHKYFAFYNQKIKISWANQNIGKLSEKIIGDLPLEGEHEFFLRHETKFSFKFDSIYGSKKYNFCISPVEEEKKEEMKDGKANSLLNKILRVFKKT